MVSSRLLFLTTGVGFAAIVYYGAGCCRRHVCDDKHTVFFFQFFSQYVGRTRAHAGTHRCTHPHMHRRTHIACVLVFVCTIACFSDVKLSSFPQNAAETFIMWASASASIWFI